MFIIQCQSMTEDEEIYREYKHETREILRKMRTDCERLKKGSDQHALTELQDCSHKIKGIAGMMNYSYVAELAEKIELVSKLLAEGKLSLNQGMLNVLLESINILAKYIETDYHERDIALLEKLGTLCDI